MKKVLIAFFLIFHSSISFSSVGIWEMSANCNRLLSIDIADLNYAQEICKAESTYYGREELYNAINEINTNIEEVLESSEDNVLINTLKEIKYDFTHIQIMLIGDDNH